MIDIQQVRQWYDIFHGDKFTLNGVPDLVEVRLWGDNKNKVFSGYFRDVETLLAALQPFSEGYAIYSPINALHPGCNARKQGMNQIIPYGATASDTDITGRRWLFIDFDPARPADTNSTDEEKSLAWKMMLRVKTYLRDKGFKSPVVADSANGYHLYYAVHLPKNDETDKLCQDFLRTIDAFFANDAVEVDLKVFNPARISKIIGTYSNKGSNTQERPQRCSWFVEVPEVIEETDISFVRNVVAEYPHTERPSRENGYNTERFDLRGFIQKYGIEIVKESSFKSGTKFILKECPFDSNHKAPDAALFQTVDGAVGFKCFHNSCSNKTWKDFRLHYDPQAYTHSYNPRQREYDRKPEPPQIVAETQEIGKKWLSMGEIKWRNPADIVHIKTGITKIDEKVGGLALGELTIISGLNACVDCDTEYFNGYEWRRISEYNGGLVMQYSKDGKAEMVLPTRYIKSPCDKLTLIKSHYGVNQCISEEHRLIYMTSKGNLAEKTLADMREQHLRSKHGFTGKFITTFDYSGKGIDLSDMEIRLMCAVICDGTFAHKYRDLKVCRFNLKRKDKKARLEWLLNELGIEFRKESYNKKDPAFSNYIFVAPKTEKSFGVDWYKCTKHQLEVVCDEVLHWDGSIGGRREGRSFSTTIKETADFVQFAFSATGRRASININDRRGKPYLTNGKVYYRKSIEYEVHISDSIYPTIYNVVNKIPLVDYPTKDGYKYCFTVPSGMLVLRRGGNINITGNSGKTSLLDHLLLSATMQGYKSLVWSGEMQDWRFMNWLDLMAAGPNFVTKKQGYDNLYYVNPDTAKQINAWIGDSVRLYNNNYGSKYSQLLADVKEEVEKTDAKLLLFDNLMAMQIDNIVGDKNEKQSTLIQEIKDYAKAKDVAIVMVCHPRKEQFFLRKDSIAGTADLTNTADNVFIIHRVGKDFFRRGEEFFGKGKLDEFEDCGNVIEVAKHRETGLVDFLVGLYYDIPSKRFKNDIGEHIVYGWQPDDLPEDMPEDVYNGIEPNRDFDNNPVSQEVQTEHYAEPSSYQYALPDDDLPF